MYRHTTHYIPLFALVGNLILLNLFFVLGFMIRYDFFQMAFSQENIIMYVYINAIWIIVSVASGTLKEKGRIRFKHLIIPDILSLTFFFILFLLFFQVFSIDYYFHRDEVKYVFAFFAISLFVWKVMLFYAFQYVKKTSTITRRVIIVGLSNNARELMSYFQQDTAAGFTVIGFFDHRHSDDARYRGGYDALPGFLQHNKVDEVYFTMNEIPDTFHEKISMIINTIPMRIRFIPNLAGFSYFNTELVDYDMIPVIEVHQGPLSKFYNRWLKRFFDLLLSSIVIIAILSWVIPLLFIIKKVFSEGSLFFVQKRSGINNKTFGCIKFRTMKANQEADKIQASQDDPRVTRIGRWLRKTNVDELPQFFNVFLNQMSVVGPRPHMLAHTDQYKMMADKFMIRQMVKPGITGLAQVRGYRGEIKNQDDLVQRIHFDLAYIERWTIWMDIKIILLTLITMIKGDQKAY